MEISSCLPSDLSLWIEQHINRPIHGFEQKKKANGTEYTYEEQIKATRYQVKLIAYSYFKRGKYKEEILTRLEWFI